MSPDQQEASITQPGCALRIETVQEQGSNTMKFAKSMVTGTGVVILAGLILALLAPKAVHAIAATAVQVMNTSAAPAITQDTSMQASQIVTLFCESSPATGCYQEDVYSHISFGGAGYFVPAGQNLVITSLDYYNYGGTAPFETSFNLQPQNPPPCTFPICGGGIYDRFWIVNTPSSTINLSKGFVVGSGIALYLGDIYVTGSSATSGFSVILHGYLTAN
jgi:hypothetical protein